MLRDRNILPGKEAQELIQINDTVGGNSGTELLHVNSRDAHAFEAVAKFHDGDLLVAILVQKLS
ncbi:MAG: hypothetical protein ACPIOQ_80465 [Promethearchaeia archaeon]